MWTLYRTCKTTASRPSEVACISDKLAAYLFDSAVVTLGTVIENAAQEQEKRGPEDKPRWELKYTLAQLLDPAFRLPAVVEEPAFGPDTVIDGMAYDEVD